MNEPEIIETGMKPKVDPNNNMQTLMMNYLLFIKEKEEELLDRLQKELGKTKVEVQKIRNFNSLVSGKM